MGKKQIAFGVLAWTALASLAYDCPPPPAAPGPEAWRFRDELAVPERNPAPAVQGPFWLENRISRCFFGPIKRAPFFRDELMDDIDYYPDAYLERLRREGVNGLWLTVTFGDLVETRYTPRDKDSLRRYAKLSRTVEKCAKYGIGIWIFAIEPQFKVGHPMIARFPDCFGKDVTWNNSRLACPLTPEISQYLEDATYDIFSHVPGLAGYINISHGERPTTCLSGIKGTSHDKSPDVSSCPRCAKVEPWRTHEATMAAMLKGICRAGSPARIISWFYAPQPDPFRSPWMYDCARHLPDGVSIQFNFESGSVKEQLGKARVGGDYWLSEPGPSEPYRKAAEAANAAGVRLSAKIQAISSHENACIPYVPVPGLLYRKFKAMHELGVKDSMLCWYFGNYPGLMNRAVGMLSASDFAEGEEAFLLRLAREAGWGAESAAVAEVWKKLSDAYANYPLNNRIQYYGPFHFGFVFPLYPKVELKPLAPTWKPDYPPSGDTIGECLGAFTLEEALRLAEAMQVDGGEIARLRQTFAGNRERLLDLGVMETLRLQFASARNVFAFYLSRDRAVRAAARGDVAAARAETAKMRAIVAEERRISEAMIPLCEADDRLGFHSEAEAHQFFPAKLRWRIGTLGQAERELDEIDASLAAGRGYPGGGADVGAPEILAHSDGTVDVATLAGTNAAVYVVTMDENGVMAPVEKLVESKPGARYKVPEGHVRIMSWIPRNGATDIDKSSEPVWPAARHAYRHRLDIHCARGDNFGRIVFPAKAAK